MFIKNVLSSVSSRRFGNNPFVNILFETCFIISFLVQTDTVKAMGIKAGLLLIALSIMSDEKLASSLKIIPNSRLECKNHKLIENKIDTPYL